MFYCKEELKTWEELKTREELLELLKKYRGILTKPMLEYLNSLIELEISVVKECISNVDRTALAELEVYKKIAIFNIYYGIQNLFSQQYDTSKIFMHCDKRRGSVSARLNDKNGKEVFKFDYRAIPYSDYTNYIIPSDFKTMNVGRISLFQTLENRELRKAELDRVMSTLEQLYDAKNPYSYHSKTIGGSSTTWAFEHQSDIAYYEEQFRQLDSKMELNDEEKREIEITKQIHELILNYYGLSSESFIDENTSPFANIGKEKTELKKTLIKRMPNLTITDYIKYI